MPWIAHRAWLWSMLLENFGKALDLALGLVQPRTAQHILAFFRKVWKWLAWPWCYTQSGKRRPSLTTAVEIR
jgi:hypothetical protein